MKFDRAFLITFNVLARLFGVLAILVGIAFLVSAYLFREDRIFDIVVGLWVTAMGIAFLLAKSVTAEQLARIRRMGAPDRPKADADRRPLGVDCAHLPLVQQTPDEWVRAWSSHETRDQSTFSTRGLAAVPLVCGRAGARILERTVPTDVAGSSYGWQADTATLYETQVVTMSPTDAPIAAAGLAAQGFIITATGPGLCKRRRHRGFVRTDQPLHLSRRAVNGTL